MESCVGWVGIGQPLANLERAFHRLQRQRLRADFLGDLADTGVSVRQFGLKLRVAAAPGDERRVVLECSIQ